jgi:hypothetical protein
METHQEKQVFKTISETLNEPNYYFLCCNEHAICPRLRYHPLG